MPEYFKFMILIRLGVQYMTKRMGFYNSGHRIISKYFTIAFALLISPSSWFFSQAVFAAKEFSTEADQTESVNKPALNHYNYPNKYQPYVELGGLKYFNQNSSVASIYDLFIPLHQSDNENHLVFTDLRLFDRSGASFEGNIHLGYRKLFLDTNSIFGLYGAFDRKRSNYGNQFNQLTFGFECWHDKWFLGGNIYQPIGITKKPIGVVGRGTPNYEKVGKNTSELKISETTLAKELYENATPGFDAELGYVITDNLTTYVGGYYFADDDTDRTAGPKIRLIYEHQKLHGHIFGIFDGISVEAGVQHDKSRGNTAYVGFKLKIGLLSEHESNSNISGFERHMVEPVRRDPDVVINNSEQKNQIEKKISSTEDAACRENKVLPDFVHNLKKPTNKPR
jgi:hypothetical protein